MVLGGVAAVLILATIAAMITDSVRGTRSGRRKTEVEQVVTPNQRNLTQEGLAAEIYALRNQIQQMQQQQAQKQPENGIPPFSGCLFPKIRNLRQPCNRWSVSSLPTYFQSTQSC